jgi:hypothetical protein
MILKADSIMVAQLSYENGIRSGFVYDSTFLGEATRPVPNESVFERLGLADSFIRIVLYIFDEGVDSLEDFPVSLLPVKIILPGMIGKYEIQSKNPLSVPSPSSSWTMDSMRRRVFLGERSRYAVSSNAS